MRKIHFIVLVAILFMFVASCKKELSFKPAGAASLTIVNGLSGSNYLYSNFNGEKSELQRYQPMRTVNYADFRFFTGYSGNQELGLYLPTDTNFNSKAVLRLSFNLEVNRIHTLFLMGTTQEPDYLLTTDQLPYHLPADSTMGLRFINISKGSAPVSVNLAGRTNGSEAAELAYKSVSAFKNYKAGSAISSYTFEFRDKASGNLLASCIIDGINNDGSMASPNVRRNRNYTVALLSEPGGNLSSRVLIIDQAVKI